MGSCISKCRSKTHPQDHNLDYFHVQVHVEDKAVISNSTPKPHHSSAVHPNKVSPSPSPSNSASSCTLSSSSSSLSSASSFSTSSSSTLSSKDRSFSNEFLWSCAKENPHVIRFDAIKATHFSALESPTKSPNLVEPMKTCKTRVERSSLSQKRPRPISPSPLTRQKSFRSDNDQRQRITLRSPSPTPSTRFSNGDFNNGSCREVGRSNSKRLAVGSRTGAGGENLQKTYLTKNEISRSVSPNNDSLTRICHLPREVESSVPRVGSKIDAVAVGEVMGHRNMEALPLEDVNNPLIALDCFIFL